MARGQKTAPAYDIIQDARHTASMTVSTVTFRPLGKRRDPRQRCAHIAALVRCGVDAVPDKVVVNADRRMSIVNQVTTLPVDNR